MLSTSDLVSQVYVVKEKVLHRPLFFICPFIIMLNYAHKNTFEFFPKRLKTAFVCTYYSLFFYLQSVFFSWLAGFQSVALYFQQNCRGLPPNFQKRTLQIQKSLRLIGRHELFVVLKAFGKCKSIYCMYSTAALDCRFKRYERLASPAPTKVNQSMLLIAVPNPCQ